MGETIIYKLCCNYHTSLTIVCRNATVGCTKGHDDIIPLGRPFATIVVDEQMKGSVCEHTTLLLETSTKIHCYYRVSISGVKFSCLAYTRCVKRCDYAIKYMLKNLSAAYGLVEKYLLVEGQLLAVVHSFHPDPDQLLDISNYVVSCIPTRKVIIPVTFFREKCCLVDLSSSSGSVYFMCQPNKLRFD